jgi:hypothetical protein
VSAKFCTALFKEVISWDKYSPEVAVAGGWVGCGCDRTTLLLDCGAEVVLTRLAGSKTDNTVPTIAPIPTPTINNRTTYNMVFAIGFNRVFRDERLPVFGFSIRTVLTITAPARKGGFPFTFGIGFTAAGMTNPDFTLRVAPGVV